MDLSVEALNSRDVAMIIAGWDVMKPDEPTAERPLFVWPVEGKGSTIISIVRLVNYRRALGTSGWRLYLVQYQHWFVMVSKHYNKIQESTDFPRDAHIDALRDYVEAARYLLDRDTAASE